MAEYIVSARKYRPLSFDTVVGQKALTTTLKNAVKSGKLAHAYLFCGPRGVGKTTCARIFAKAINCMTPTAEGEACGECESCKAFNEQRSFNIFELDAASNNSVEHIKTLMEQTRIPPQVGKYKVFIIDEVHMLSTAAFNAFLKTLEEPPAHVIFVLATTEKHKILPTILSRCQIYDFERMTVQDTIEHLKNVAEREGIKYEEEALAVIADKADGGMRDALSIFDQAASFCQGDITYEKVIEDLNVLDSDNYFKIVDLSLKNNISEIMVLLNSLINKGFDGGLLIGGLAKHVRNVLMAKDESTLSLLEVSENRREQYRQQAERCDTRFLYRALKIMNNCDINYRQSNNKRLLVELTLIEVGQITQPDDTVSAGRGPKRLKTLFKNIISQPRKHTEAPQVATAGKQSNVAKLKTTTSNNIANKAVISGNTQPDNTLDTSNGNIPDTQQQTTSRQAGNTAIAIKPNSRIVLKNGNGALGYSWNNLRQMAKPKKMQIIPGTLGTDDPNSSNKEEYQEFSQQELEFQWMSMCNRMPPKFSGIAARMKNMNPLITEFPNVEVTAENQIILDEMQNIRGSIVNTLKLYLHNSGITLNIKLAERHKQEKLLTRREQFELMSRQNPAVEKLRKLLNLELA
ncbi:MAG: DNA polymerase III subunit gamma/tau [Prevotella sp.]|nr:DNA polymerase III subunit gamma/tau [Prevotella sp.]